MSSARVLVCDDEELIRWSLSEHLRAEGYEVELAINGRDCIEAFARVAPDALILDLRMPEMDGLTALRHIRERDADVPVIVVTAHGAIESAIEATNLGATAYLSKPFDLREVSLQLGRALEATRLADEVRYLRGKDSKGYHELVGESAPMQRIFETLRRLESVDAPTVLITGESGTGKELVARAIHRRGPRRDGPFMEIDCASLPETLIESELFGHERGAFTDARQTKRGLFEAARGGLVFLDEIGEMDPGTQAKLLRALESRRFRRVGGVTDIPFEAAVVAATNRDLRDEVAAKRFREDLFFRLNVIPVELPPLRRRTDDVPLLVSHLLGRFRDELGSRVTGVAPSALEAMKGYAWPGNVRELRNVLERIAILEADREQIRLEHLPAEIRYGRRAGADEPDAGFRLPEDGLDLDAVEKGFLIQALERTGGNQSAAARLLGISRYQLRYRMEKFGFTGAGEKKGEG